MSANRFQTSRKTLCLEVQEKEEKGRGRQRRRRRSHRHQRGKTDFPLSRPHQGQYLLNPAGSPFTQSTHPWQPSLNRPSPANQVDQAAPGQTGSPASRSLPSSCLGTQADNQLLQERKQLGRGAPLPLGLRLPSQHD